MSSPNRVTRSHKWQSVVAVASLLLVLGFAAPRLLSQPQAASSDDAAVDLWIDYWEACLKLAEADLKLAEATNQRVKGVVTKYDLQRLELQREFFVRARSEVNQGRDFGNVAAGYAELNARLAALDVQSATAARRDQPSAISDAQYERAVRHAEVCRLQAALVRDPDRAVTLVDHLHGETHRLSAEVMQLERRISQLEEIVLR